MVDYCTLIMYVANSLTCDTHTPTTPHEWYQESYWKDGNNVTVHVPACIPLEQYGVDTRLSHKVEILVDIKLDTSICDA